MRGIESLDDIDMCGDYIRELDILEYHLDILSSNDISSKIDLYLEAIS